MPIRYHIDHERHYVEAHAEGDTDLGSFEDFLDAIVVQGAPPYRKLFDGRTAIGRLNEHDIMS